MRVTKFWLLLSPFWAAFAAPIIPFSSAFENYRILHADTNFQLGWTTDDSFIHLGVVQHRRGWVALGLSPDGGMINSDSFVGYVSDLTSNAIVEDYFITTVGSLTCPGVCRDADHPVQPGTSDYDNVTGWQYEQDGGWVTELRFSRKLNTGDPYDLVFKPTFEGATPGQWVIYAWDPDGQDVFQAHGRTRRGAMKIDFFPEIQKQNATAAIVEQARRDDTKSHGVRMMVSVLVLSALAIFIRRYMRQAGLPRPGERDIQSGVSQTFHILLQVGFWMIVTVESGIMLQKRKEGGILTPHGIVAFGMIALGGFQILFGTAHMIKCRNYQIWKSLQKCRGELHRASGRALGVLSVCGLFTGIQQIAPHSVLLRRALIGAVATIALAFAVQEALMVYFLTKRVVDKFSKAKYDKRCLKPISFVQIGGFFLMALMIGMAMWPIKVVQQLELNPHLMAANHTTEEVEANITTIGGNERSYVRTYWIKAEPVMWDYVPKGCSFQADTYCPPLKPNERELFNINYDQNYTFNTKFQKARYVYYTPNFAAPIPEGVYGILGNVMRAEVGDTIRVNFINMIPRNLSIPTFGVDDVDVTIHSHGTSYGKGAEGFGYAGDRVPQLSGLSQDDVIPYGKQVTLNWAIKKGPTQGGPGFFHLVHSHGNEERDTNAGLVTGIVIHAPGTTDIDRKPFDLQEAFLVLAAFEERTDPYAVLTKPGRQIHTLNGYLLGNTPVYTFQIAKPIVWYTSALGKLQTPVWNDAPVNEVTGLRSGTLAIVPYGSRTLIMTPHQPGIQFFWGMNGQTLHEGTWGRYKVTGEPEVHPPPTDVKSYYMALEYVVWDYAPGGLNGITGENISRTEIRENRTVWIEYTDESFTKVQPKDARWEHTGMLGPTMHVRVGEELRIVVKNTANVSAVLMIDGGIRDGIEDYIVMPVDGSIAVYTTYIWSDSGPGKTDPTNSIAWLYHLNVPGPLGAVIVSTAEGASPAAIPSDCDREFVLILHPVSGVVTRRSGILNEVGFSTLQAINGYAWGNVPGLTMRTDDKVRWYVLDVSLTSVSWGGQAVLSQGRTVATLGLGGASAVIDMTPEKPGTFLLNCPPTSTLGQFAQYTVTQGNVAPYRGNGLRRIYYIAVEEIMWDFLPGRFDFQNNMPLNQSVHAGNFPFFVGPGVPYCTGNQTTNCPPYQADYLLGTKLKKAIYVEYTDDKFTVRKPIPARWQHTGFLGPTIRAQVGDTIVINFLNSASKPFNMYAAGFSDAIIEPVHPGNRTVYTWDVLPSVGPGESDPGSKLHPYSSNVGKNDFAAGLSGPIIILEKTADHDISLPKDIDREFVIAIHSYSEMLSPYLDENIQLFGNATAIDEMLDSPNAPLFELYNTRHGINGYQLCAGSRDTLGTDNNGTAFDTKWISFEVGERVRFYVYDIGGSSNPHSIEWHGQVVSWRGRVTNMVGVVYGAAEEVDLSADTPGVWLLHGQGAPGVRGMSVLFEVLESSRIDSDVVTRAEIGIDDSAENATLSASFMRHEVELTWQIVGNFIRMTMRRRHAGYLALGFGSVMTNADMVIAQVINGKVVVGDYHSLRQAAPVPDNQAQGKDNIVVTEANLVGGCIEVEFVRPLNTEDPIDRVLTPGMTPIMIAVAPTNELKYHGPLNRVVVSLDLFAQPVETEVVVKVPNPYTDTRVWIYHGVAMGMAWVILAPPAGFMVRFGKSNPSWLVFHRAVMMVVGGLTFVAGFMATTSATNRWNSHHYVGMFMVVATCVQLSIGFWIEWLRKHITFRSGALLLTAQRLVGFLHRFLGRVLVPVGLLQAHLGLSYFPEIYSWPWMWPVMGGYAVLFIVAQIEFKSPTLLATLSLQFRGTGSGQTEYTKNTATTSKRPGQSQQKLTSGSSVASTGGPPSRAATPPPPEFCIDPPAPKNFTWEQWQAELESGKQYVRVGYDVYDVSSYLPRHPGGYYILNGVIGRDLANYLHGDPLEETGDQHTHSARALRVLSTLKIGTIKKGQANIPANDPPAASRPHLTVQPAAIRPAAVRAPAEATIIHVEEASCQTTLRLIASVNMSPNLMRLTFEREDRAPFELNPDVFGQYIKLTIPDSSVTRIYLIIRCRCPDSRRVQILAKYYPTGSMTPFLRELPLHQTLLGSVEQSYALEKRGLDGKIVIIAAGTGVLAFMDFIDAFVSLQARGQEFGSRPTQVTILQSYRAWDEVVDPEWWADCMRKVNGCQGTAQELLSRQEPDPESVLHVHVFLQQPDPNWTGNRGYFSEAALKPFIAADTSIVYVCGTEKMKGAVTTQLQRGFDLRGKVRALSARFI